MNFTQKTQNTENTEILNLVKKDDILYLSLLTANELKDYQIPFNPNLKEAEASEVFKIIVFELKTIFNLQFPEFQANEAIDLFFETVKLNKNDPQFKKNVYEIWSKTVSYTRDIRSLKDITDEILYNQPSIDDQPGYKKIHASFEIETGFEPWSFDEQYSSPSNTDIYYGDEIYDLNILLKLLKIKIFKFLEKFGGIYRFDLYIKGSVIFFELKDDIKAY